MRLNIQSVRQTYKQTSDKRMNKQEQTDRLEIYKGLYARMAEPMVSRKIDNYQQIWTHALTR